MIQRLEKVLIAIGLLDTSQEQWERTAGVWMFSGLAVLALLLIIVIFDDLLLDRRFNFVLRPIGLLGLLFLIAGAGYWGINARRHSPRAGGKLGWRAWAFILLLIVIASAHVFNYISASA